MRHSFAVEEALIALGQNLKAARIRRRLTQAIVAERSGISLNTLSKIEKGDPGIAMANVASVINALGLIQNLSDLCSYDQDSVGMLMEEKNLPQRVRQKKTDRAI